MSTRGFLGFVVDGDEKITYNHSDSYPDYLGANVLAWLRGADLDDARQAAARLRVVGEQSGPTDEDIAALTAYYNPNVGGPSDRPTWYQLLRETQGDPAAILAAGTLEDGHEFPRDSLWAEWGYLVDFDATTFEVYRGSQQEPHDKGRFANRGLGGEYQPVALIASWTFDALPDVDAFFAQLSGSEGE